MEPTRQRIVVGVDGSPGSREALVWALTEAAARGAAVEVVTAFPIDFYWTDPYLVDERRVEQIRSGVEARTRELLDAVRQDRAIAALPGAAELDVEVLVGAGAPALHLVQQSESASLLVVGSRGRGALRSALAGSVALHCAAHAACPVVVVHPGTPPADAPPRVVVGLTDSPPARAALVAAREQAQATGARLDVVVAHPAPHYWVDHALAPPPIGETEQHARAQAETVVAEVLGADALEDGTVQVVAVEGHPVDVLLREAESARLLVVGCRSRNELPGILLGSVALRCVMHAPCPVLVVHPGTDRGPVPAARAADAAVPTPG
jgi:nucleotide-binding universal stress UspA family protein